MTTTDSPIVETVSRKRLVTSAELAKEQGGRTTPEFWEFIEKMTPQMWGDDFILYILREDPKPSLYGGTNTLEKCPGYIAMPDGTKQPLSSREDIELAIKQKYGGKAFRLILKRANGERICEGKCINEAPPKYPSDMTNPLPHAAATDATVATRAIDAMAAQPLDSVRMAMEVLRGASEIVMRHKEPSAAPAHSMDSELDRAFKQAMIARMTADPLDSYLKIRDAIGGGNSNGGGMGTSANALLEKVLSAAVDKILNPVPAQVTGRTTLLDVGREVLPALISGGKEMMHEYRLSIEAQARIADNQRGMQPQAVPAVPQQNPPAAIATLPAAVPQPTPQQTAAAPSMTFPQIASYIANVVKNAEHTTDEAVEDVLAFLYNTSPDGTLVRLLLDPPKLDPNLKPGKDGLLQLFQFEPSLNACLTNLPRVSDFLDKFIVAAKESEEAEARLRAAAPASTKPS